MNKHSIISLSTLLVFMLYYLLITGIVPSPVKYSSNDGSFLLFYLLCCIPPYIVLRWIHKKDWAASGI